MAIKRWAADRKPPCWEGDLASWQLYRKSATGVTAPCADCTREYQSRMEAAGRCIRPEVIFVLKRSGAQIGVTIDEPLYARILIGDVEYLTVIGAVPPRYMLRRLSARAHPAVLGVLAK